MSRIRIASPIRLALGTLLIASGAAGPASAAPRAAPMSAAPMSAAPMSAAAMSAAAMSAAAMSAVPTSDAPESGVAGVRYQSPVPGPIRVVRRFEAPAGPYAPGHRGVDLAAVPGGQILAAGAGVVDFAGPVAGRGVIVLRHPDGVRTEYEPIAPSVRAGQTVAAGQPIGVLAGRHPGCAVSCLHWGARRGPTYFDPLRLLLPLGVVRLVPAA